MLRQFTKMIQPGIAQCIILWLLWLSKLFHLLIYIYIAFAGTRVVEQTLNMTVPEGSQEAEYLFDKGLFDPIVPHNIYAYPCV